MGDESKNQGEGDYEAARRYRDKTEEFADSGEVEEGAEQAREAVDGPEGDSLRDAEEEGKSRSRGEDPKLKR